MISSKAHDSVRTPLAKIHFGEKVSELQAEVWYDDVLSRTGLESLKFLNSLDFSLILELFAGRYVSPWIVWDWEDHFFLDS
jgi:hypothetical protein